MWRKEDQGSIRRLIARHQDSIKLLEDILERDDHSYVEALMMLKDVHELGLETEAQTFKFIRRL